MESYRPQYILQPQAWEKVLPPHFLAARNAALQRALELEPHNNNYTASVPVGGVSPYYAGGDHHPQHHAPHPNSHSYLLSSAQHPQQHPQQRSQLPYGHTVSPSDPYHPQQQQHSPPPMDPPHSPYASHHSGSMMSRQQQQQQQQYRSPQSHHHPSSASEYYDPTVSGSDFYSHSHGGGMEEGDYGDGTYDNSYLDGMPMDEAIAAHASTRGRGPMVSPVRMDPPEDQPPRLSLRQQQQQQQLQYSDSGGGASEEVDPYDVTNTTSLLLYPREPADPVADRDYPAEPYYRNPNLPGQSRGDTFSEAEEDYDNGDPPPQQQYRHHHPSVDRDYPSEEYSEEHDFHPDDIVDEEENGDAFSHPHYSAAQSPEEYGRYDDEDDFHHAEHSDEYHGQESYHSRDMDNVHSEYDERNHFREPLHDDFDDEDRGSGHYGIEELPVGPPHYPQGYGASQSPDGGGTEFSIPSVSQSGMISRGQFNYTSGSLEVSPDNSARDFMDSSPAHNAMGSSIRSGWSSHQLPPTSPQSVNSNNNDSHNSPSSVTRGAQEFLRRRNQQRRAQQQTNAAMPRPQQQQLPSPGETSVSSVESPPPGELQPSSGAALVMVESASSGGYWETGSARSELSGTELSGTGSSAWMSSNATEDEGAISHAGGGGGGDARSSRRALILQMAKARMKSNVHPNSTGEAAAANAVMPQLEDEKKDSLDVLSSDGMDFANDLD